MSYGNGGTKFEVYIIISYNSYFLSQINVFKKYKIQQRSGVLAPCPTLCTPLYINKG